MSDRVAVMYRGGIEQVGPKLAVYNAPETRFVAAFVGAPNRLEGRVAAAEGGRLRIDWNGLEVSGCARDGAGPGERVEVYLKSERISLDLGVSADLVENQLEGRVRDIIFKGQFADYLVRVGESSELVVSAPPALPGIERGARVRLGWASAAADVFRAPPEETPTGAPEETPSPGAGAPS